MYILIAFIATPIIEIALFIEAGERFGLWPTLAAVIATAFAGTWLLRRQGLATWTRAAESLRRNVFPIDEVFTGLCLVMAGALLLTPGFVTDAIGLALFAPPVRRMLAGLLRRRLERGQGPKVWVNGKSVDFSGDFSRDAPGARSPKTVIDAEFKVIETPPVDDTPDGKPNENSPWRKDP